MCPGGGDKRLPFQSSPHRDEIILALREGTAQGINPSALITAVADRFPVSKKTVGRYLNQLKAGKLDQPEKPAAQAEGGKIATITARQPAPVIFSLGKHEIELEPQAIYESYLLYEDMRLRCQLTDGFSSVILDGVGLLWRILASEPRIEKGEVKMEVKYGGGFGPSESETGPGEE